MDEVLILAIVNESRNYKQVRKNLQAKEKARGFFEPRSKDRRLSSGPPRRLGQRKPFKQHPQSMWKTVTAEGALLSATRTRMHTQDRTRLRVAIVSTGRHHNLRNEAPDLR